MLFKKKPKSRISFASFYDLRISKNPDFTLDDVLNLYIKKYNLPARSPAYLPWSMVIIKTKHLILKELAIARPRLFENAGNLRYYDMMKESTRIINSKSIDHWAEINAKDEFN
jgi:hypothetical protein